MKAKSRALAILAVVKPTEFAEVGGNAAIGVKVGLRSFSPSFALGRSGSLWQRLRAFLWRPIEIEWCVSVSGKRRTWVKSATFSLQRTEVTRLSHLRPITEAS
jgi:hypothetical protein